MMRLAHTSFPHQECKIQNSAPILHISPIKKGEGSGGGGVGIVIGIFVCSPFNAFTAHGVTSSFSRIISPLYTTPKAPEPSWSIKLIFSYGISVQLTSDGL